MINIEHIVASLRLRRDTLSLAHESLKRESDLYNKSIIVLSLSVGFWESVRFRLGITSTESALVPIAVSSIIAAISSFIRFKHYPETIASIVMSMELLTSTLTHCRNQTEITPDTLAQYNDSLQSLEVSLYPSVREKFLKLSKKNLVSIMSEEKSYYGLIDTLKKAKKGVDDSGVIDAIPLDKLLPDVVMTALSEISPIPDTKTVSPLVNVVVKKKEPKVRNSVIEMESAVKCSLDDAV